MNKKALKKNEWSRVKIRPIVKRFWGVHGPQLPPIDEDWMIETVDTAASGGIKISNPHTGHGTTLGWDQIHHYTGDPNRGSGYGVLTLNAQLHIGGNSLWIEPTYRPGQPLIDQFGNVRDWQRRDDPAYIESLYSNNNSPATVSLPTMNPIPVLATIAGVCLGFWLAGDA